MTSREYPVESLGQQSDAAQLHALLERYGEAMAKVAKLEMALAQIQEKLDHTEGGIPSVTALSEAQGRDLKARDETIASLRLRISTLTSQLARTEEKLQKAYEGNYARIKGHHRRRWWMFWRRRR